jgi:hypothetical protein
VKEWVLAISVGHTVDKQLRLDDRDSYEASQVDSLGNTYPICAISGLLLFFTHVHTTVLLFKI